MSPEPSPTQERIRQVAGALFAERGYGGTSVSDIAQQVGISKAGLYNYYSSKEALFTELVARSAEAWRTASRPSLQAPGSCQQRLREHLRALVRFTRERPHEVAILRLAVTLVGGELGQRVMAPLAGYKAVYSRDLEEFFHQAIAGGEVRANAADVATLALSFRVFLDGLLFNLIFGDEAERNLDQHLDELWQPLWRGLAGPGGGP